MTLPVGKVGVKDQPAVASPRFRISDEHILDAACAVFASEGFERAGMDAIAARAEITKPTLYSRFGSKEALFAAAVAREYELRKARLFAAYETGDDQPFRQRLHRWVQEYFELVRERPDGFLLISEGVRHPAAAAIIAMQSDEIVERIADLVVQISGRRDRANARLVAAMIAGSLTYCAREALVDRRADIEVAAALCESFLLGALRGLDASLLGQRSPAID